MRWAAVGKPFRRRHEAKPHLRRMREYWRASFRWDDPAWMVEAAEQWCERRNNEETPSDRGIREC